MERLGLDLTVLLKLALATLFGGLIGFEREWRQKPAGLRTHMFICIGSALFTLLSFEMAQRFGGDPVRIAAQLIPGIGFIGAGTIIRERGSVVGLTTAATLFVSSAVGMAVGSGFYLTAGLGALLTVLLLLGAGWFEARITPRVLAQHFRLRVRALNAVLPAVTAQLAARKAAMERLRVTGEADAYVLEFEARVPLAREAEFIAELSRLAEGECEVRRVEGEPR